MEAKYTLDTQENREFLAHQARELLDFGRRFPSPGGSAWYLGDDGTPWKDRNRETWITCRMAHVYSIGCLMGVPGCAELVDAALKGLAGELHDNVHSGWYPGLTPAGEPLPDKLCYTHAFVILAASSALLAGRPGAADLLNEALAVFDGYFWQEDMGLAVDTWDTAFQNLSDYRGLNANMHTVEAFLAVADATGRERYRERAGRIISRIVGWAGANGWRIPEHYTKDWRPDLECNKNHPDDPFKPYGATPGHGIEWARLITQWTMSKMSKKSQEAGWEKPYLAAAENLFRHAVADGWQADGQPGIVYTTDWQGNPCVHDRMHWTLAEAINTSSVLAHVTHKKEYADAYASFMAYLDETVIDHVHGSWFHQLDRENHLLGTVWPGKSDLYHAFQSMLIPYSRVDCSIAAAVAERNGKGQMMP